MNDEKKFRQLAIRVKVVRWLITIGIVIVVLLVGAVGGYWWTQKQAGRESQREDRFIELVSTVMAPNISVSDRYLADTNFMGGKVTSHRYKDIEGYHEAWSPIVQAYSWSWLGNKSSGALNAADTSEDGAYDRLTQHKIPLFYNPKVKDPSVKRTADVTKVARTKQAVAEVAVSFDHPLTYAQIQQRLPKNLHAVWYWIGVDSKADATFMDNNFLGVQANSKGHLVVNKYENYYRSFHQNLERLGKWDWDYGYTNFSLKKYAQKYAKQYPTLKTAKFSGAIVTGDSENFKPLNQANWIYASSAGFFQQRTAIK
ncbi:anti sigma factor C-terminal domain-containing protein [Levilactobacillus fujinensis]|uniref:Anti sigma factor C-terminal domain-containing protein n=1 Tax=Levilactobacillus fujinensis TaxID=2486024 RepID=A0ABW1TJK5_9LACO|nr:anti sigma factor C-terminal domain-containing protein [Levilactobacillus fujinensis]